MGFPLDSLGFLWDFFGNPMGFHGISIGFLKQDFSRISVGFKKDFYGILWYFHGIPVGFLWGSYGISMIFLLDFYDMSLRLR